MDLFLFFKEMLMSGTFMEQLRNKAKIVISNLVSLFSDKGAKDVAQAPRASAPASAPAPAPRRDDASIAVAIAVAASRGRGGWAPSVSPQVALAIAVARQRHS